jgi:hypothetical protein
MLVNEALRRISFKVGTLDDITGRAVNPIISNRYIVDELNSQLRQYANITKGIQDVFSMPLNTSVAFIQAPTYALRSQAYYFGYVYSNSTIFPLDIRGVSDALHNFRYNPINGITAWLMPWGAGANGQYLSAFPMKSQSAKTTTITSNISLTDTTIPVASSNGFVANHGRFTIDSEKILYTYKDNTNFYGCVRGVEMTTAVNHTSGVAVTENNLVLFYSRLPVPIVVHDDNIVPQDVLDRPLEVVEEHMEGIIKLVAFNLLIKLDPERAGIYKMDSDELFKQYAMDIRKGYAKNRQGSGMRSPYIDETGIPFASNMQF